MMALELSIIVPAYNEQDRIKPTLEEYLSSFSGTHKGQFEIIVVLNGCHDSTREVVASIQGSSQEVVLIEFENPLGKGGAIIQGMNSAQGSLIAYVDADNMVGAKETQKLIAALKKSDIAIADRFNGNQIGNTQPLIRRVISVCSRIWIKSFLGLPYSDTQCGAKAFKAVAWNKISAKVAETGWAFDLEVLAVAKKFNFSVAEIPVEWKHVAEGSKVRAWKDVPSTLWATLRIKKNMRTI